MDAKIQKLEEELKKAKICPWCGSNDLVCGKAWKEERDKLKSDLSKLRGELDKLTSLLDTRGDQIVKQDTTINKLQAELEDRSDKLQLAVEALQYALQEIGKPTMSYAPDVELRELKNIRMVVIGILTKALDATGQKQ